VRTERRWAVAQTARFLCAVNDATDASNRFPLILNLAAVFFTTVPVSVQRSLSVPLVKIILALEKSQSTYSKGVFQNQ
jgi:hypothetical protein